MRRGFSHSMASHRIIVRMWNVGGCEVRVREPSPLCQHAPVRYCVSVSHDGEESGRGKNENDEEE
jgi:hypothetical protein